MTKIVSGAYKKTWNDIGSDAYLDLDRLTGKEADFNILLQNLLTILKYESKLTDAIVINNVEGAAKILKSIIVMISPLVGYHEQLDLDMRWIKIKALAFPEIRGCTPSSPAYQKKLNGYYNDALEEIWETWLAARMAMQTRALLTRKQSNPREAVKG
jgi:hypothetical protein